MINPETLVKRTFRERDLLPIATDAQVIERFQERIEDIRREVKSPIRAPHYSHSNGLLHISGEEEFSLIGGEGALAGRGYSSFARVRAERGHAQELLFKTMEAYGFDQENSKPRFRYNYMHRRYEEEIIKYGDGTTREVHIYPSQTVKGLVFERVRSFVTNTGETTDIWWNVVDEGPDIKVDIPSIFRRNPKPTITTS